MESRERALVALNVSWFNYFKQACCPTERIQAKKFHDRYLKCVTTTDPELINWTNWGQGFVQRMFRTILYWIMWFILLFGSYYIVLGLENYDLETEKTVPNIKCKKNFTRPEAVKDYSIKETSKRDGSFHCFCK